MIDQKKHLKEIFKEGVTVVEAGDEGRNLFASAEGQIDQSTIIDGDVKDRFQALAAGESHESKLAWADTLRNVRTLDSLTAMEPVVHLDIGCGIDHSLGRLINGAGLSTTYIGMDPVEKRAFGVTAEKAKRPFIGFHADASAGIPLKDSTVDFVTCFEAMEHFVTDRQGLINFFKEIERVCTPGATFMLATPNKGEPHSAIQHSNCHENEFADVEIMEVFQELGFYVASRYNYRARRSVMARIHNAHPHLCVTQHMYPVAFSDAIETPILTMNNPVPGNVFYTTQTPGFVLSKEEQLLDAIKNAPVLQLPDLMGTGLFPGQDESMGGAD